jgi:DUF1009 family protein
MQGVLGIVAGGGDLPRNLIAHCVQYKIPFHIVAIKGQANAATVAPHPHTWVRFGAARAIYTALKNHNAVDVVMIGTMQRPTLLQLWPDFFLLKFLPRLGLAALGDDGLLKNVVALFERHDFRVRGIHEFLPELLAPAGVWTDAAPTAAQQIDIEYGVATATAHGAADLGQAVVIHNQQTLALENKDGTDAMLRRLLPNSGGIMVKLCKPQQDTRVDLPTIGTRTVENAAAAGLNGIVVSAGNTLVIDRAAVIAAANARGMFVLGVAV